MKIDNWSVHREADPYVAPECRQNVLVGDVEGKEVILPIRNVVGRTLEVKGKKYTLGRVKPAFRRFMLKHYPLWNMRSPLDPYL